MKHPATLAIIVIGVAFAVAACGGSRNPAEPPAPSQVPATVATQQPSPTAAQVAPGAQPTQNPLLFTTRRKPPEEMIVEIDKILKLDPENADAYYERGRAHHRLGNLQQAIDDFSEAIRINPRHAGAYNARGLAFKSLGELDQAFNDMMQAASMIEELRRFDMERMIIGFLINGRAVPYDGP